MLKIEYSENGRAINDFQLEDIYRIDILNSEETFLSYSTENIFNRIRYGIVYGELNYKDIVFVFEHTEIPINEYGAIINWPNGFCEININLAEKIMRIALNKRDIKEKRYGN